MFEKVSYLINDNLTLDRLFLQDINGVIGTTGSKLYIPKSAVSNTLTIVA